MRRSRNSPQRVHANNNRSSQRLPVSITTACRDESKLHARSGVVRRLFPTRLVIKYRWPLASLVVLLSIGLPFVFPYSGKSGTKVHPRYIKHIISGQQQDPIVSVTRFRSDLELYPSKRNVYMSKTSQARQTYINDHSDSYEYGFKDEWETKECRPQYDWQLHTYPTCNTVHESNILEVQKDKHQRMLGHGYWRDVWLLKDGTSVERFVLKTMRYTHEYEERNYDRHRRDAVAMERLTSSPMIVDIYGFCGNSGVFEFAQGGSLSDAIWNRATDKDATALDALARLHLATQASMGVAAVHNSDKEGVPSIVHTDISPSQFVGQKNGLYKLNDFNRARFLLWNITTHKPCTYHVGRNPGKNRSPEEYSHNPQTEKVDVYSLGNVIYMLLTGLWPFEDDEEEDAQKQVKKGLRPAFPIEIWNSSSPILIDMKEAMFLCHEQEIEDRGSARQVETMLLKSLHRHDPSALQRWGLEREYGKRIESVK